MAFRNSHAAHSLVILIHSFKEKSNVHSKDEPVLLSRENVKFKSQFLEYFLPQCLNSETKSSVKSIVRNTHIIGSHTIKTTLTAITM